MQKVKGFIIAYRLKNAKVTDVKTLFIAHYSEEEAKNLFLDYAEALGFKDKIAFVTCVKAKQKLNKRIYTKEYVAKEISNVENLKKGKK